MCVAKKYQLGGRFWTIAIVAGVMVACVNGMFGFGSVLREAAERSGNVVGFAKSQSLTYDSFNDSVAMTSQVLALENASQLAHSISYGGDEVDQADLERAARLLGVSNAFVLTVDGQLVSSYSNNNVTFGMVQHEITADVALDVVDHPRKVYGTRIVFDDGSYIDVGCAARIDQAGMVVAGYYTSEAFSNRYMLSLQNMLAGYDVRGSGDIVVESDGSVVAANMVSDQMSGDIQLDPVDAKVVEDIKSRCQVGETTLLLSGSKPYIASLDKARDYYVFTFMPVSSCLGEVAGLVLVSVALYCFVVAVFAFSRRKSEHEHLHQLVLQEHEYADRLAMSAHQAQSANRAKTEFLQRMSHDIRTPINGISGMLDVAEHYSDDLQKQAECRQKIREASDILFELVSEVLDMSKLESGEIQLEEKPFDVVTLLDEVTGVVGRLADERNITVAHKGRTIEHRNLIGSPVHLKRLLMNIMSNAVKYNRDHGHIYLYTRELPSADSSIATLQFVCEDNGIGMSEEFQQRIFEPFTQEQKGGASKFGGTGLGMSIAKSLAEKMGGTISFESTQGVGTTFVITIPFKIDTQADSHTPEPSAPAGSIRGLHILLVEDNELNMEIAEFLIQNEGATVTKAWDGQQAVTLFAKSASGEFDAILMDVLMPVMNGYEATRQIRALDRADAKTIPIIAMTANAFTEDRLKSKEAGMDEHITKPIDSKLLVKVIAALTGKNAQRPTAE